MLLLGGTPLAVKQLQKEKPVVKIYRDTFCWWCPHRQDTASTERHGDGETGKERKKYKYKSSSEYRLQYMKNIEKVRICH